MPRLRPQDTACSPTTGGEQHERSQRCRGTPPAGCIVPRRVGWCAERRVVVAGAGVCGGGSEDRYWGHGLGVGVVGPGLDDDGAWPGAVLWWPGTTQERARHLAAQFYFAGHDQRTMGVVGL